VDVAHAAQRSVSVLPEDYASAQLRNINSRICYPFIQSGEARFFRKTLQYLPFLATTSPFVRGIGEPLAGMSHWLQRAAKLIVDAVHAVGVK
jgi:hypothetical protein